jgi:hypothetical protein
MLDSSCRRVILEGSTPLAVFIDVSKVPFGSKNVRGKLKKWEVELKARIKLADRSSRRPASPVCSPPRPRDRTPSHSSRTKRRP